MAVRAALKSSFNFVNLHNEYNKLDLDQDMVDGIRGSIRRDTKVWFNFTSPGRYTAKRKIFRSKYRREVRGDLA